MRELLPIIIGHRFPAGFAILILPRWGSPDHTEPISDFCREFGIRTKRLQLRPAVFTSRGPGAVDSRAFYYWLQRWTEPEAVRRMKRQQRAAR